MTLSVVLTTKTKCCLENTVSDIFDIWKQQEFVDTEELPTTRGERRGI